ncbi:hypothetical protein SAMN02927900_00134 [Rhizobium mongolense subsp. loessense]|uniref:Lipoprotein n=1 Tax=Rhizobium mongolense subsp. loessense TaxID=158890 RepID=A0A1G4P827_9HYPH|nr:hypothetical protein [Rhizobium mongolense]SCW28440.1 hypothetical protein SAMN02927900_00134 [Rhizobium mongolense subsp. loessense]
MRIRRTILIAALALSGCTSGSEGIEPIRGSITYGGQPAARLSKSPPGSVLPHQFIDPTGRWVEETYIIQPDRSLKLVRRRDVVDSAD